VWGRGYVVPDAATEARLRRIMGRMIISAIGIGVIGSQIMLGVFGTFAEWPAAGWATAGFAIATLAFAYRLFVAQMVEGLSPSPGRLPVLEAVARQAEEMPIWYLWLSVIGGGLLAVGAALMAWSSSSTPEQLMGVAGVALFAVVTLQACYGLSLSRRRALNPRTDPS
jgi:hypothetical protein